MYDNLEFVNGLQKNEKDVITWSHVKTMINKPHNLYEITRPNKNVKIFVDIDGKASPNISESDFYDTVNEINEVLSAHENDFVVMGSSKYNHIILKKNKEEKINKYSWRLTFKNYIECVSHMSTYVKANIFPEIESILDGIIKITWDKSKTQEFDVLDIDPSVYRVGFGKMRTINAYKHPTSYEIDRVNKMVNGGLENHLIHCITDEDKFIKIEKPVIEKPVIETRQKPEQPIVYNTNFNIKQRQFNKDAIKPTQMIDLLMNFLKNDKVDWSIYFKVGSTLAHNGYKFKIFDDWCRLSKEYNSVCNNRSDWNSWVTSSENMCIGIIINLLKEKTTEYSSYKDKYMKKQDPKITLDLLGDECELINHLRPFLYEFIRYTNKKWYVFNNNTTLWEPIPNIQHVIVNYIGKLCMNEIKSLKNKIKDMKPKVQEDSDDDSEDEEDKKEENKKLKKIKKELNKWEKAKKHTNKSSTKYEKYCETQLLDNEFYEKLDNHIGFLAFQDCMYHIASATTTPLSYDNYLTKTLPYPYQKGNEKDKAHVREILKKICNYDDSFLDYYLSVIGYSFTGYAHREQNFWVFYGSNGSNGKSKPFEIMEHIFGDYCVCGNTKMLQEGSNKEHKSIPSVAKSYVSYFNELPKENKINNALIKTWRDGATIKNEIMFGTESTIKINSKMFIISNHKLNFGKDGGMNRSLIQLPFNARFEDNLEEEDYENLYFKKDKELNTKLIQMKYSFIELIMEYGKKYLDEGKLVDQPECVKQATADLIKENDTFLTWLSEYFVFEAGRFEMVDTVMLKYTESTDTNFKTEKELRKYVLTEMRRIGTYPYDKLKMRDGKRGAFKNIRMKTEKELMDSLGCLIQID